MRIRRAGAPDDGLDNQAWTTARNLIVWANSRNPVGFHREVKKADRSGVDTEKLFYYLIGMLGAVVYDQGLRSVTDEEIHILAERLFSEAKRFYTIDTTAIENYLLMATGRASDDVVKHSFIGAAPPAVVVGLLLDDARKQAPALRVDLARHMQAWSSRDRTSGAEPTS